MPSPDDINRLRASDARLAEESRRLIRQSFTLLDWSRRTAVTVPVRRQAAGPVSHSRISDCDDGTLAETSER
jgi:hypothetical protein